MHFKTEVNKILAVTKNIIAYLQQAKNELRAHTLQMTCKIQNK